MAERGAAPAEGAPAAGVPNAADAATAPPVVPPGVASILGDCAQLVAKTALMMCVSRTAAAGAPLFRGGPSASEVRGDAAAYEKAMAEAAERVRPGAGADVERAFAEYAELGLPPPANARSGEHPVAAYVREVREGLRAEGVELEGDESGAQRA